MVGCHEKPSFLRRMESELATTAELRQEVLELKRAMRFTSAGTTPTVLVAEAWMDLVRSNIKPLLLSELQQRSRPQRKLRNETPASFAFNPSPSFQASPSSPTSSSSEPAASSSTSSSSEPVASAPSSEPPTVGDFVELLVAACAEDEPDANINCEADTSESSKCWSALRRVAFEQAVAAIAKYLDDPKVFTGGEDWEHAQLMADSMTEVLRAVFEAVVPGPWADNDGAFLLDGQPSAQPMPDDLLRSLMAQCAKASALRRHRNVFAAHPFSSKGEELRMLLLLLDEAVKMPEVVTGMETLAKVAAKHMHMVGKKATEEAKGRKSSGRTIKLSCVT